MTRAAGERAGPAAWALPVAVAIVFAVLYWFTAQRGVSWQDSGEFQYRVLVGDYVWNSGIARAHPLYIALARGFVAVFPAAARLDAVSAFSGVGMAFALALVTSVVRRLTGNLWAAVVAACALGLSQMGWWMATCAEVYTWSLAALALELYCLARYCERGELRWMIALFGANGVHAGIHNFAFVSLPVYLAFAWLAVRRVGLGRALVLLACAGCAWLVGAGLLVAQVGAQLLKGCGVFATVRSLLFGVGYARLVLGAGKPLWPLAAANVALAGISLLNPCWLYLAGGWRGGAGHIAFRRALACLTALHAVFWIRYFAPDQATFVLPTLTLLAVWAGLGCGASFAAGRRAVVRVAVLLALGTICSVAVPQALCAASGWTGLAIKRSRELPFRDETRFWIKPWKQGERSAAAFVGAVAGSLRPGDALVADATAAGALLAARAAGVLPQTIRLVTPWSGETDDELRALVSDASARTYVVSPVKGYAPQAVLGAGAQFVREGVLYRAVISRGSAAP